MFNNDELAKLVHKFLICKYAQTINLAYYTPAVEASIISPCCLDTEDLTCMKTKKLMMVM